MPPNAPKIELFFVLLKCLSIKRMLLDLINHQEELFAAIIAPMSYRELNALRVVCKALFAAVSGAYRWQHMRDFTSSLKEIQSIHRALLCDDSGIRTTIVQHEHKMTAYVGSMRDNVLRVYSEDYVRYNNIESEIIFHQYRTMIMYEFNSNTDIPQWLYNCTSCISILQYGCENIFDIRP